MLPIIPSNGASQYQIPNSLRFRSSASAYLNRTPASAGNQQKWTWSGWVKRGTINASANMQLFSATGSTFDNAIQFTGGGTNDVLRVQFDGNNAGVVPTAGVYRDPSAWYHIVVAVDTTQATSSNRVRIYVNGVEVAYGTATYPTQNYNTMFNSTNAHNIGRSATGSNQYFDGYMADINFIDGQALTPSSFGQISTITGVWQPIAYTGTYGTNGFHLNFSNGTSTTTLGYDSSGNGNNWTTNNISLTAGSTYDWMIDSPTPFAGTGNGVGNYAVLNPLDSGSISLASANLNATFSSGSGWNTSRATIWANSGKWYWEITAGTISSGNPIRIGITQSALSPTSYLAADATSFCYANTGEKITNNSALSYGSSYVGGDVIGVALDLDAGTLTFYKNGVSQGQAYNGISGSYAAAFSLYVGQTSSATIANFGQRPFAYTPPTGFKALCTQNLPAPLIKAGNKHFDATTYTGNGSTQSIVNAGGFQPDLVWVKSRSFAINNYLTDSVRGASISLYSDLTAAESSTPNAVNAFLSNGFTTGNQAATNQSASTFVAWQWKANGAPVANNAGSIASQVSANTTAGFSVVTYTSPSSTASAWTVGHGLGVAPSMIISKERGQASAWLVYHASLGNTQFMQLNGTGAASSINAPWNNTSPTSTVATFIGNNFDTNTTQVFYCFAAIPGFSAFGSYTGNGSADGPFCWTGFLPRFVMIKRTDTGGYSWFEYDSARDTYNVTSEYLIANGSQAEQVYGGLDLLSNGFKLRGTAADLNASGGQYVFAAFAANPFQNALAR
jgi:SPRY domain/Concanavalin A-like lectin/glucanases superfamily